MDDAWRGSVDIAIGKAWTARAFENAFPIFHALDGSMGVGDRLEQRRRAYRPDLHHHVDVHPAVDHPPHRAAVAACRSDNELVDAGA